MIKNKPLRCKDCPLYDKSRKVCKVIVLHEGQRLELPTKPNDLCIWKKIGIDRDINTVGIWSDGKNGYVEVPEEGFVENDE